MTTSSRLAVLMRTRPVRSMTSWHQESSDDNDDNAEGAAITTRRRSGAAGRGVNQKRWLVDDD